MAASLCAAAEASAESSRAQLAPSTGLLLVIGQDQVAIAGYVRATGHVPAGLMAYTSIQDLQGLEHPAEYGAGVQHADALLARYPGTVLQIGLWMVGALEGITQGAYDGQITRLAAWVRQADVPVYLRVGYEFDLPENGYEPEPYVRAFRHLVEAFRRHGVTNAAFVWHSYGSTLRHPLEAWYPGDAYVDWVGVSYFDQQRTTLDPVGRFARQHGKPLMIGEAAPRGIGVTDARLWRAWWDGLRRYMNDYGALMLCYINADWEALPMFRGQGWYDARIQANPQVRRAWDDAMAGGPLLQQDDALYARVGFTPTRAPARGFSRWLRSWLPYRWR